MATFSKRSGDTAIDVDYRSFACYVERPLLANSVEKVGFLKLPKNWSVKAPFSTLLREISVRMPLLKLWISISGAYIFAMATKADFFNRIGRLLPVATGRNRPEVVIEHLGNLGRFRLSQARYGKSEVGIGTADHSMTSAESVAIPLVQFN